MRKLTTSRSGDFWNFDGEDGRIVARELQITLMSMCGIPAHAMGESMLELAAKGYLVVKSQEDSK